MKVERFTRGRCADFVVVGAKSCRLDENVGIDDAEARGVNKPVTRRSRRVWPAVPRLPHATESAVSCLGII